MYVVILFLFIHPHFSIANEEAYLLAECQKGNGIFCSYYASKIFSSNKTEAIKYFKLACQKGVSSSCVFDENYQKMNTPSAPTQKQENKINSDPSNENLESWAANKIAQLLSALDPTDANVDSGGFSVDQCRMPLREMVKLAMGLSKSYTHTYKFGPNCDVDGSIPLSTNQPFYFKAKVQKLGEITQFEHQTSLTYQKLGGTDFRQTVQISNGIIYDSNGTIIAKFAVNHISDYSANVAELNAYEKANSGRLIISEFHGQPVHFEKTFVLDHLIKRLVFHLSGTQ